MLSWRWGGCLICIAEFVWIGSYILISIGAMENDKKHTDLNTSLDAFVFTSGLLCTRSQNRIKF